MSRWDGKTRGGVLGYMIFVFLLSHFPLLFVYFILRFVVIYFVIFAPRASKSTFLFLHERMKLSTGKSLRYLYKNFYFLGQTIIDKLAILSGISNPFTFEMEGEDYLHQMVAGGKGGLLISAHVGNWDVAGNMLNQIDAKINIIMLDAEHEMIKKYMSEKLINQRINIIPIRDDLSHIISIKKALQNNELLCMHGDRFLEGVRTISADFLGSKASFPYGPFSIPLKFGIPVAFVFAMKDSPMRYHFYATKPVESVKPAGREEIDNAIKRLLLEYIKNLEVILHRYPEQWFNYYEFWN